MLLPGQAPKSLPVQPSPLLSLFAGTGEDKALESDSHLRDYGAQRLTHHPHQTVTQATKTPSGKTLQEEMSTGEK